MQVMKILQFLCDVMLFINTDSCQLTTEIMFLILSVQETTLRSIISKMEPSYKNIEEIKCLAFSGAI